MLQNHTGDGRFSVPISILGPASERTRAELGLGHVCWVVNAAPLLEAVLEPAFLLSATGVLLGCNATARALLAAEDGLTCAAGQLRATGSDETGQLGDAVAAVAGKHGGGPRSLQVVLPRASGQQPLGLLLVRWMLPSGKGSAGGPQVLAIAYAAARDVPDNALRFGLTAAETRVADDLVAGWGPQQIAARQGRSVHTVRSHLARLMAKTRTSRQADLVRKLMQPEGIELGKAA